MKGTFDPTLDLTMADVQVDSSILSVAGQVCAPLPFIWAIFLGAFGFAVFLFGALASPAMSPLFSKQCLPARRSSGLVWGLMAGLPGFASHGSGLNLGAGCH